MTPAELLAELRARGADLVLDGDRLRLRGPPGVVEPELTEALRLVKPALLEHLQAEVRWRVEAMRQQVPASGPVPLLVARRVQAGPGHCPSCGEPTVGAAIRCSTCATAAREVLGC